jgi:hypothetical protein
MAEPVIPEPKFFLSDEIWERGIEYYSVRWFAPLPAGRLLGEKSTNYLESPKVAERIHSTLPWVKLIFSLRNPVDRAWSNYLWSRQNGLETETFERALVLEEQREREQVPEWRDARPYAYFSRGLYAEHLSRFFDRFPREQILVFRHELLAAQPARVAATLHRFLGVAEMPETARGLGPINAVSAATSQPLDEALRRKLAERYRSANAALVTLLDPDFELWGEN